MQRLSNEHKQRICAAFASTVRFSNAKTHINPDKFFLEMSGDFERLFHQGILDLNPLFVAYSSPSPIPEICGAFMAFEEMAPYLGIKVRVPEGLTRLPLRIRNQYRAQFEKSFKPQPVAPPDNNIEWLKSPQTPIPIRFPAKDLVLDKRHPRAFSISEASRITIADAAAWAIKDSPGGHKINGGQIVYLLREYFDRFCDGNHLDLDPLLTLWRKKLEVDKRYIRGGLQRLKHYLGEIGISLEDPLLGLSPSARMTIYGAIEAKPDLYELYPPPSDIRKSTQSDRSHRTKQRATSRPFSKNDLEKALTVPSEHELKGRNQNYRRAFFALAALTVLISTVAFYFIGPGPEIDVSPYDQLLPMTHAKIVSGSFHGTMDLDGWKKMSDQERLNSARVLSERLEKEGLLVDATVALPSGRIAIFYLKGHKLKVTSEALWMPTPDSPESMK